MTDERRKQTKEVGPDYYSIITDKEIGKVLVPQIFLYNQNNPVSPGKPARILFYGKEIRLEAFIAKDEDEREDWLADAMVTMDDISVEEYFDVVEKNDAITTVMKFSDLTMEIPDGLYRTF